MKAEVWRTIDGLWVADMSLEGWVDRSYFNNWWAAFEHALFLADFYRRNP